MTDFYNHGRLFVPTMVKKLNGIYFIVDHDHHRIIYSATLDADISNWTEIDYEFAGPHSITSDGSIYVVDNTGRNEVLVFNSSFVRIQTIPNVGVRPHKVVYDTGKFYVLSSMSQTIYCYTKTGGVLAETYNRVLPFLGSAYVRSIKIIDGFMYFIANDRTITKTNYLSTNYEVLSTVTLPSDFTEIVDIEKFNGEFYVSAMGTPESGQPSKLVRGSSLTAIVAGTYTNMYDSLGMLGKPYLFEMFDSDLFLGEVGEVSNSIISITTGYVPIIRHRVTGVETGSYQRSAMYPK